MNDRRGQALADRLTAAERERRWPNIRPKDAATLIIIDRTGRDPKVLMGRRHHGHRFMPGKFVFPGRAHRGGRPLDAGRGRPQHASRAGAACPRHAPDAAAGASLGTGRDPRDLRGDRPPPRHQGVRPARARAVGTVEVVPRARRDAGSRGAPARRARDHAAEAAEALRHPLLRDRPRPCRGRGRRASSAPIPS